MSRLHAYIQLCGLGTFARLKRNVLGHYFSPSLSRHPSTNYQGVYAVEYTTDQPNVCEMAI